MNLQESQHLDFKQSWQDSHLKTLAAFANTEGGMIHLGKDDQGVTVALSDAKSLLETLPGKIIQKLGVYPRLDVNTENNCDFITITVEASPLPVAINGKYYQRVGSTNQEIKGAALSQFLISRDGSGWDDVPEPRATLDDLSQKSIIAFTRMAAERIPSIRQEPLKNNGDFFRLLQKLNLAQGEVLTRAAVLLFGVEPQSFYRESYTKVGLFASDADLLSDDQVRGNLFAQAEGVMGVLQSKYLVPKIYYQRMVRREKAEYPETALREAIVNSIVHRDYAGPPIQVSVYDDKLIFWNEGSLPNSLEIADLKERHPSRPRNKTISDIFYKAGYIEAWGRGTLAITQDCLQEGLPEPEFRESFGGLEVIFFKDRLTEENLQQLPINDRQRQAIAYLKQNGRITNKDYQRVADCSRNTATNDLKALIELDIIEQAGQRGAGSYYVLK